MKKFTENNPIVEIEEETEHKNFKKLWNDETFMIRLPKSVDFSKIYSLKFPQELSAIYHIEKESLEFIMTPLLGETIIDLIDFNFYFEGKEFKCEYKEPSEELMLLSSGFREIEENSSTDYRNLRKNRDFQRKDEMPKYVSKYFENRKPLSFFITGDFNSIDFNYKSLSKHFNFYVRFYDRENPQIIIHEEKSTKENYNIPCLTSDKSFPKTITFNKIDPVLLDMFQISQETQNVRLKYIFYFQILEYCSYYYLNEELSKQLKDVIRRPDLLNNTNEYTKLIVEQFKDHFKHNDDSSKLEKTINDYCTYQDIKIELHKNLEFFTKPIEFDGGFKIDGILNDEKCIENPPKQILRNVKNNIEKIRNTLVHLRESRENKVILPTERNNNLLIPYLFIVRRLAEKISIMHGE